MENASAPEDRQDLARRANAILSAGIFLFFVAHIAFGCAFLLGLITDSLAFLVWVAVGLAGVHVVMCIVTSYKMLSDTVRPPSDKKKRHLVLKWVTGGLVLLVAGVHVAVGGGLQESGRLVVLLVEMALAFCLASHTYIGVKSLLKDLGIARRYRTALRMVICVLAGLCIISLACGIAAT